MQLLRNACADFADPVTAVCSRTTGAVIVERATPDQEIVAVFTVQPVSIALAAIELIVPDPTSEFVRLVAAVKRVVPLTVVDLGISRRNCTSGTCHHVVVVRTMVSRRDRWIGRLLEGRYGSECLSSRFGSTSFAINLRRARSRVGVSSRSGDCCRGNDRFGASGCCIRLAIRPETEHRAAIDDGYRRTMIKGGTWF